MWPFSYSSSGNSPFTERTQIPHSYLTGLFAMATGAEAHGYCSIKSTWPCKKANWPMTAPKQNLNCQMINLYLSTEGHAHECQPTRKTLMIKTTENLYNEMDRAKQRKKIFRNQWTLPPQNKPITPFWRSAPTEMPMGQITVKPFAIRVRFDCPTFFQRPDQAEDGSGDPGERSTRRLCRLALNIFDGR